MCDPGERYSLVFNGEIFNYRQLRDELQREGWQFRTSSDTEVLLAGYVLRGPAIVPQLNGQFAFAVWDSADRTLFAARDRFGEKPFYYAIFGDGAVMFASELRAILATNAVQPQLDLASVDAYLSLLYVPPDRCIYANMNVLPPAHTLTWRDGKIHTHCYWQPALSARDARDADVIANVRTLLEAAVQRQMVADVPVGAFLSGGLDSATVVALMSRHNDKPVETFSVGFGDVIDELPYARLIAEQYRTHHHELQARIPVAETIERMADVYDEPFADSSNVPSYCIAEFARRNVTVALSGDGGDELFGGYDWYAPWVGSANDRAGAADVAMRRVALWSAMLRHRVGMTDASAVTRASARYRAGAMTRRYDDIWASHLAMVSRWWDDRSELWGTRSRPHDMTRLAADYKPPTSVTGIDRLTWFDLRTYLPGDILVKVDRAAMAHSLESRAPFLDVDLSSYVLSLPASVRFTPGRLKGVLKDACGNLWPDAIRNRKKQGFGAPVQLWMKHTAVLSMWQRVTAKDAALCTLLPGLRNAAVTNAMDAQQRWTILQLGLWLEKRPACLRSLS
jgi:asparagine synthase (glutamine-hydrolysing)